MNTKLAIAALLAPKCSGGTKIALQGFALMANDDGLCTATPSAVAKVVGLNRSTICRAIEPLLQIGYLVLVPNGFKVIVPDCDSVADCNNSVADCNNSVADCNNSVADCNNSVADCNNPVADCNNEKAQRKENPPQKSASLLLPPTPPIIITSNTLYPPSEEKKSVEGKAIGESEGGFAALPPPPSDSVFDVKEIAIDASRRLIAKGLSADEAIAKLRAVKVDFEGKAKALTASGDLAAKANPKGYLAAMWASMAMEGPKPTLPPQAICLDTPSGEKEPRDLYDILDYLRDKAMEQARAKFGKLDPYEAAAIRDVFSAEELGRQKYGQWTRLLEKQELAWYGESSAVACVRKVLGLDHILFQTTAKIEAERYKTAKKKVAIFRDRKPRLEKELADKVRPNPALLAPGEGYLLQPWRELDEIQAKLPIYERTIADFESTHKMEVA